MRQQDFQQLRADVRRVGSGFGFDLRVQDGDVVLVRGQRIVFDGHPAEIPAFMFGIAEGIDMCRETLSHE